MYSHYSVAVAIISVIFPVWASTTVALRFYIRHARRAGFGLDDYLALVALGFAWALCLLCLNGSINASIGRDLKELKPADFSLYQKHIYFAVIFAYSSFGIVKLSVIMLYKRVFAPICGFVRILWVAFAVVSAWTVVTFFLAIFSAWPVSHFWELGADYSFDHPTWLFVNTCLDTLLDILVLCLPLHRIWLIEKDFKYKLKLTGVFAMGLFCVVSAGLRIYFGYKLSLTGMSAEQQISDPGFGYIVVSNVIWCEIESCCSVIAACLPSFAGIMKNMAFPSFLNLIRSWTSSTLGSLKNSRGDNKSTDNYPLSVSPCSSSELSYEAKGTQTEAGPVNDHLAKNTIRVTEEYTVHYAPRTGLPDSKLSDMV